MSAAKHQRRGENAFLGRTPEAMRVDVAYARQLWLLQWALHDNPHVVIQIENPMGVIENHPLSTHCVLRPYEEGGLGCKCAFLSNCMFPSARHAFKVYQVS